MRIHIVLCAALMSAVLVGQTSQPVKPKGPVGIRAYAQVLSQHVGVNGRVDYAAIRKAPAALKQFLDYAAKLPRSTFDSWSKNDQLAFLINAYNGFTIDLVQRHYPKGLKTKRGSLSIRTLSKPWDRVEFTIMGKRYSLNGIEHDWIRKQWTEPRIHMALVCAARGCPPLSRQVYVGSRLQQQLDQVTRSYLASPSGARLEGHTGLKLSKIFSWYQDDWMKADSEGKEFRNQGAGRGAVLRFAKKYANRELAKRLSTPGLRVSYLDYDWTLNSN